MKKRLLIIGAVLFFTGGFLLAWTGIPPSVGAMVAVAGLILLAWCVLFKKPM